MVDVMSPDVRRKLLNARAAMRDGNMVVVSGQVPVPQQYVPSPIGRSTLSKGSYRPWGSTFLRRTTCPRPLSVDCSKLTITGRWAAACFLPSYVRQRKIHGDDFEAVVRGITYSEPLPCKPQSVGPTPAAVELSRRIRLSTAVLMRQEGVVVAMPQAPAYSRPAGADRIRQPWMRALLTGWI